MDKQITVLDWDYKPVTVTARHIEGGLALHPAVSGKRGYWTISHIASGRRIGNTIRGLPKALAILSKLVPLWDWTQEEDSFLNLPFKESQDLIRRIREVFEEMEA